MMVDEYVRRRDDIIKTLRANGLASSESEARRVAEGMLATEVSVQKNFDKQKDENTFGFKMKSPAEKPVANMVDRAIEEVVGKQTEKSVNQDTPFKVHAPSTTSAPEAAPTVDQLIAEAKSEESPLDRGEMFKFD